MGILAGLAGLALLWWSLKPTIRADPARFAGLLRQVGGAAALVGGALLALRGRFDLAVLLAGGGAWLLGWGPLPGRLGWLASVLPGHARAGASARLRSARLAVEVDRRTGAIAGRVLAGRYAGRDLAGLSDAELVDLRRECLIGDPAGADLLEAYLDRRSAGWREHAEPDPDRGRRADAQFGAMTEQEAHEILGLQPGADQGAIRRAHRGLMKRLHPDRGGSTYLASRVNQAKDRLLHRHG